MFVEGVSDTIRASLITRNALAPHSLEVVGALHRALLCMIREGLAVGLAFALLWGNATFLVLEIGFPNHD